MQEVLEGQTTSNINKRLCTNLNINQWKNTASVIEWLRRVEQKPLYKFTIIDIKKLLSVDTRKITKERIK